MVILYYLFYGKGKTFILLIYIIQVETEHSRGHRDSITFDEIRDNDIPLRTINGYNNKLYQNRRSTIAGYGYHRRRLKVNQDSRGSKSRSSVCVKSGKHNLVSSTVHRNLLILILASFVPLLLLQGEL